jgi:Ca2+-binding EF-hand superfamily protein
LDVADVDGSGGIDFDEFLSFMGPEGSTSKAIKGSLLGVL